MEAIDALLALKGTIDLRRTGVVEGPATALVYSDWTLNATGPDADPTALFSGKATDVLAKQADGHWLMILDDPWSSAPNARTRRSGESGERRGEKRPKSEGEATTGVHSGRNAVAGRGLDPAPAHPPSSPSMRSL
jgi:hypothetical protein